MKLTLLQTREILEIVWLNGASICTVDRDKSAGVS
jgi:hypothetical protein